MPTNTRLTTAVPAPRTQVRRRADTETGSPAKGKRLGIGARMAALLAKGYDTQSVLNAIHREFPQSRATGHDVSIIRRRMANKPKGRKAQGPARRPPRGAPIH